MYTSFDKNQPSNNTADRNWESNVSTINPLCHRGHTRRPQLSSCLPSTSLSLFVTKGQKRYEDQEFYFKQQKASRLVFHYVFFLRWLSTKTHTQRDKLKIWWLVHIQIDLLPLMVTLPPFDHWNRTIRHVHHNTAHLHPNVIFNSDVYGTTQVPLSKTLQTSGPQQLPGLCEWNVIFLRNVFFLLYVLS